MISKRSLPGKNNNTTVKQGNDNPKVNNNENKDTPKVNNEDKPKIEDKEKPDVEPEVSKTPEENKVSKEEAKSITNKRASILDKGTGRDFAHYTISSVGETNKDGYPQTIQLRGDRLYNSQTMTFKEFRDGVAIYTIGTGKKQEYRLEKDGDSIKFTQREGDSGYDKANWNKDG